MSEQCMHDGKAGPCERPVVEGGRFCRRHLPAGLSSLVSSRGTTRSTTESRNAILPAANPLAKRLHFGSEAIGVTTGRAEAAQGRRPWAAKWRPPGDTSEVSAFLPRRRPLVPVKQLRREPLPLGPVVEGLDGEPRPVKQPLSEPVGAVPPGLAPGRNGLAGSAGAEGLPVRVRAPVAALRAEQARAVGGVPVVGLAPEAEAAKAFAHGLGRGRTRGSPEGRGRFTWRPASEPCTRPGARLRTWCRASQGPPCTSGIQRHGSRP